MWGYLSEFWDSITETVVGGVTYTVEWFEQIGNAVAGAVGNLFDFAIHGFSDVLVLMGWFGQLIGDSFNAIITPISFIFNFLKSTFVGIGQPPIAPDFTFPASVLFEAVPAFGMITGVLATCLVLFLSFSVIKHLINV